MICFYDMFLDLPKNFSIIIFDMGIMTDTLTALNNSIREAFSNNKSLIDMRDILKHYDGNDWQNHVVFSESKYNRIKLFEENDYDLYLLCWKKGQNSAIHDHPNNGCLLKILKGRLEEHQYNQKVCILRTKILATGELSYLEGNKIVHQINPLEDTVTLHIYSPSNYIHQIYHKNTT